MSQSNSYWEKRKVQNMFGYMQSAEDTADSVSRVYLKASKYLSYQIDSVYDRYTAKHKLSEKEAISLLNSLKDKTSIDEMIQKLNTGLATVEERELIKVLESQAYRARIDRLQELQNEIDLLMNNVYQQEREFNTSHYVNLAQESYYKSIFDIQQMSGYGFNFSTLSASNIDKLLNSKWSGENYSSRIWNNTGSLAKDLKEELLVNLLTGRTNKEVALIIQNKFAQSASNARRLVRTESTYIANEMEMQSYQECGIETYIYIATLDLKTSSVCRDLDNKRFKVKEKQPGLNCPPMHPWCRSTTICNISDEELSKLKRRVKDPVTGKVDAVSANTNYDKWYKENVTNNPKAQLEEKKIKNLFADKKQHKKYKQIMGKDIPSDIDEFQGLKYNNSEKWEEIKDLKQDKLNQMDFQDMKGLTGKLGNKETRLWYKAHDENIPNILDYSKSIKEQAIQACNLRNQYRTQARDLMKDQKAREILDRDYPNPTLEQLVERKKLKYGMTDEETYQDIVRSSTTTNKKYDKISGLEG